MWVFIKFVVFLSLVIVSVLVCFLTALFLKRQNVLVDWRFQYKDGPSGPNKDEEQGDCPAEHCQDERVEESCDESNSDDLLDCKSILEDRFGQGEKPRDTGKRKPSKDRALFSWSKGKVSCAQGKVSCENTPKSKCSTSPSRKKCVSFQRHSSSTCECSGSASEISVDDRRGYWETRSGKRKVDCFVLLDSSHVLHNRNANQSSPGNEEQQQSKVVPAQAYGAQQGTTDGKSAETATVDENKSEHARRRSCGRNNGGQMRRDEVEQGGANKGEPGNERIGSEQPRGEVVDSDLSGVQLTPFSNHTLEKLREKRKERKRKLMKLQHESGRLKSDMKEWISGSNSDAS